MARRRRRRRYGAVARGGSQYGRRSGIKHFKLCGRVVRNVGGMKSGQYAAEVRACAGPSGKVKRIGSMRDDFGTGRTPTGAVKKALREFARRVK